MEKIIDATDSILGRLASYAAKQSLLGFKIKIVNCENAVISGNQRRTIADFKRKRAMGVPKKGPFIHRMPDRIVRRTIRGMLPYKKQRGKNAFQNIMCYIGVPDEYSKAKLESVEEADVSKLPTLNYIYLKTISKELGAKLE